MKSGVVITDVEGLTLSALDRERLMHPAVIGVILFAKNYHNFEQVAKLITDIQALRDPRLLVCVDQEGGRVQRIADTITRLPSARAIGQRYLEDRRRGLYAATEMGWLMAVELSTLGIDFSLAPVVDVLSCDSVVIGDRSFGEDPMAVSDLAVAYLQGMHEAGMSAVAKHFPGHGGVSGDSHTECPLDSRSKQAIISCDLMPFEKLIAAGLRGVMTAHVCYQAIDDQVPCYSSVWLKTILRQKMRFRGIIFSDDLSMQGADESLAPNERARLAFEAGCDVVLVCQDSSATDEILSNLNDDNTKPDTHRMRIYKRDLRYSLDRLHSMPRWQEARLIATQLTLDS